MKKAIKRVVYTVGILTGCALQLNTAIAADVYGKSLKDGYEAPAPIWQGLYAGLSAGGFMDGEAQYDFEPGAAATNDTNSVDMKGILAGGHLGYNAQFGKFVLGVEGDAAFAKTDDPTTCTYVGGRCESSINSLFSLRARGGVTLRDNLLFYATGGLSVANVEHTVDFGGQPFEASSTVDGVVYGGGIEYMHRSGVTVGFEVLHHDFDTERFNLIDNYGNTIPTEIEMDNTVVKGRVGFHFN